MKIDRAVERANAPKGKTDQEAVQALREHFGSHAAMWVADGKIDAEKSQQALEALQDADMLRFAGGKYKGCVTVTEWLQAGKTRKEADPLTGAMLIDGVSTDEQEVDWSKVSMDRRLLAVYAIRRGGLVTTDIAARFRIAEELAQPTLTKMWPNIEVQVGKLKAAEREALEEGLYFQPTARPFAVATEEAPAPVAQPKGPIGGTVPEVGTPRHQRVYIVAAPEDGGAAAALRKNLKPGMGMKDVPGTDMVNPGVSIGGTWLAEMSRASIVVVMMSSDLLVDERCLALIEQARGQGKRIVPVNIRPCLASGWIKSLVTLPRTGEFRGKESEVAGEIVTLLGD